MTPADDARIMAGIAQGRVTRYRVQQNALGERKDGLEAWETIHTSADVVTALSLARGAREHTPKLRTRVIRVLHETKVVDTWDPD